jgi:hypothetical protein
MVFTTWLPQSEKQGSHLKQALTGQSTEVLERLGEITDERSSKWRERSHPFGVDDPLLPFVEWARVPGIFQIRLGDKPIPLSFPALFGIRQPFQCLFAVTYPGRILDIRGQAAGRA